jgi:uncharacterized protein
VIRLEGMIRSDPDLMALLHCLRDVALPRWRIVSGCLYQMVWNVLTGRPRGTGIQDIDIIYFDDADLSWKAEDAAIKRVTARGPLQIRNQARVHIWYEQHFGVAYAPLRSADESLLRYPIIVQAVGARLEDDGRIDIVAPFGLEDVFGMVMRPSPTYAHPTTFAMKVDRARAIWPEVTVVD